MLRVFFLSCCHDERGPPYYLLTQDLLSGELFPLAMWAAAELTTGLMVACMPAARLFVLRYWPRVFCGLASTKRKHGTDDSPRPPPPFSKTPHSRPKPKPLKSLKSLKSLRSLKSQKSLKRSHSLQTLVPEQSLSPKDLDKYRNYAMHVSVSSPGVFSLSGSSQASPVRMHDYPEPPGSARTVATLAEYMDVPERLLEEEGLRQVPSGSGIYVKHDFEVVHSNAPSPVDGEDPWKTGTWGGE